MNYRILFLLLAFSGITFAQERLYIHTDRTQYEPGDTLWFSVFQWDIINKPSRMAYVELYDDQRNLIDQIRVWSQNNNRNGYLVLPESVSVGYYLLRGYTQYMLNQGEESFFTKTIQIGKPVSNKSEAWDFSCGFYPEGGRLIEGKPARISFKAMGSDGKGTYVKGIIYKNGTEISQIESMHAGMGRFTMIPEKNVIYTATIESNGLRKDFLLPKVESGLSLRIAEQRDTLRLMIQNSYAKERNVQLVIQSLGNRHFGKTLNIPVAGRRVILPLKDLPQGLICITIYNEENLPECERLYFVPVQNRIHIGLKTNERSYPERGLITMQLTAQDMNSQPIQGCFSVSVTDETDLENQMLANNIFSYYWLTSELSGTIENPGWYFLSDSLDQRREALDVLLTTQGWRRYPLTQDAEKEDDFRLTGQVLDLQGKPLREAIVSLWDISANNDPGFCVTDENGKFGFMGFDNPDGTEFLLKAVAPQSNEYVKIVVDKIKQRVPINTFPDIPVHIVTGQKVYVDTVWHKTATNTNDEAFGVEMGEVVITQKRNKAKDLSLTNKTRYEVKDNFLQQFNFADGVEYVLSSILPSPNGLPLWAQGTTDKGAQCIIQRGGMNYESSIAELFAIPVSHIQSIQIIPARFDSRGSILVKMSSSPQDTPLKPRPGLEVWSGNGYCVRREVYQPPYETEAGYNNEQPDTRRTLYWNPDLITDSTGEAEVTWYAADQQKKYIVVVEGQADNFMPCWQTATFAVNRPKDSDKIFDENEITITDPFVESELIQNTLAKQPKTFSGKQRKVRKSHELTADDIRTLSCSDIYCVLAHLSGVKVNGRKIRILNSSSMNSSSDPLIIVNGMPVSSLDDIVSVEYIKKIKVELNSSLYGVRGANGVLVIETN